LQLGLLVSKSDFETLLAPLFEKIRNSPLDDSLERALNEGFPITGAFCQSILEACLQGDAGGWVCEREAAGIRYGRVVKPNPSTSGFSVDVVQMREIVGPHHVHPNGEIDLILPTEGSPTFDKRPAGWLVYGPGSGHRPTVEGGCAYILYLLPGGAIDFTRT
jgi:Domain of unknown function (DUF4863)